MTDQTLDDGLDIVLDDLADLPQNAPFPAGAHHALMFLSKNAKKAGAYTAKFKYVGTLEFANPADAEARPTAEGGDGYVPPKENDEAVIFINTVKKDGTKNEFGQGQLKQLATPVAQMLGTSSVNEVIAATKNGIGVVIVTGVKPATAEYSAAMTISKISLLD